jgi:phthiocerol/phenolphthiocerol synthesis type-I polyketide synthase C
MRRACLFGALTPMLQPSKVSEFGSGIAIVGMSCVFPGGIDSIETLWQFLCDGRDAVTEVPPDRWNNKAVYEPDPHVPGKTSCRWGGFVHDIGAFDAAFFGISPREAAAMDPQQRLLLEATWRAFEDAGLQAERLAGSRTGVYIGISYCDYNAIQRFARCDIDVHTSTGSALSIAANRLSHRFDLRGPSLCIDTACSSSMVALDAACTALANGECELAIVGGVNAILTPDITITFSRASMLSPDGRCKSFDSRANGYVRSEGVGVVVLKPLLCAREDGDHVRAVIRATAVNQDGRTSTITVPNLDAQIALLQDVCRRGAIDPFHIGYVEAHGTGTPVGDPIEA